MAKKTHRINGQEVCVKASNAVYNGSISDVDNAQAAIDNLDERVAEIENGGGGGSVEIISDIFMTDDSSSLKDIKRVFYRQNYQGPSGANYSTVMTNFESSVPVDIASGDSFELFIEIWTDGEELGVFPFVNFSNGDYFWLFRSINKKGVSRVKSGPREVYKISGTDCKVNYSATGTTTFYPNASLGFGLIGCEGRNVMISAWVECNGAKFLAKTCKYTLTTKDGPFYSMDSLNEWPDDGVTVGKLPALIDNHMLPMCSAGSEYDPFVKRNTTPRVLVTIMSDDGGMTDYSGLRTLLQAKQDVYNENHPTTPVEIGWTVAIPSNLVPWNEINDGDNETGIYDHRMTARTLRELVANNRVSIMSHGYNHVKLDGNVTGAQTELEAVNSKRQLEREIGVPCIHYCLPGGTSNQNHLAVLYRHFLSVATTESLPHDDAHYSENTNYPNRLVQSDPRIRRFSCDSLAYPTAPGDRHIGCIQAAEDYVAQNSKSAWIVFYTHSHEFNKCVPSGTGTNNPYTHGQNIAAIVDYCLENGIPLVNYSEAYAEIYPPIDRLSYLVNNAGWKVKVGGSHPTISNGVSINPGYYCDAGELSANTKFVLYDYSSNDACRYKGRFSAANNISISFVNPSNESIEIHQPSGNPNIISEHTYEFQITYNTFIVTDIT